jgi:hypothetical protein
MFLSDLVLLEEIFGSDATLFLNVSGGRTLFNFHNDMFRGASILFPRYF